MEKSKKKSSAAKKAKRTERQEISKIQVPIEKIEGKETRQEEMEIEIKSKEIANNEFDIFANDSEVVLGTEQISREEKKADDIFQNGGQIFENDISIKTVEEQVTIETESKQNDFTVESVGAAKDLSEENNDIFAETKVVNTETADDCTEIKTEVTNTSFETTESTNTVADNGFVVIETNGETTVNDAVTAVNAAETAINDTVTAGTEAEIVEGNTKTSEINTVIEDNNFDTSEVKAETTENNMETLETADLINASVSMDVSTEIADAAVTENKENTEMANDTQIVETENVDTTTPNFDVSTEQIDITTEVKEIKENYESQQESIDVTPNKTDIPSEISDTEANAETEPQDNIAIAPVIETKASNESEMRALDENLENISNIEITSQSEIIENVSNNEIVDQFSAQEKSLIPDSISIPDIKISPDTDNEDQLLDDKTPDNSNDDSIKDTVCDEIITSTDISNEEIKPEIENGIISIDSKTLKSETQTEISQIEPETTTIKDVANNENLFEENANFEIATKETSDETAFESTQEVKTESSDNLLFETNDKLEPEQTETSPELKQDSIKSEAFSNDTQEQDSKVDGFETDVKPLLADSGNVKQSDSKEEVVSERATKPVSDSFDTTSIDSSTAVIDFAGSSEVTVETSADKTNVEIKSIDNISALNEFMKDEIKQHDIEQKEVSNVDPRDDWDIIEMGEKEKIESKKEETDLKENIKETVEEPKSEVNEKAPKKSEESKISPIEKQMTKTSDVIEKQTTKTNDITEKQTTKETSGSKKLVLDFPTSGSFKPPKVVEESQGQSEEATTPQQTSDTVENKETLATVLKHKYEEPKSTKTTKISKKEPKKLQHPYEKDQPEEPKMAATGPKEQDLVAYTTPGTEHNRHKYLEKVAANKPANGPAVSKQPSKWDKPKNQALPPVNRQVVEKIEPPKTASKVKSVFESGQIPDIKPVQKTKVEINPDEGPGVYENEPTYREGVVRESDMQEDHKTGEGHTGKLLDKWMRPTPEFQSNRVIKLAEDEGKILENEPEVRTDVAREADKDVFVPDEGKAKQLKQKWLNPEEKKVEKKIIKLVENENEGPIICENQPTVRTDVIRADEYVDDVKVDSGRSKNLKGFWKNVSDDPNIDKKQVVLNGEGEGWMFESQPIEREGVVRERDSKENHPSQVVEKGKAKNISSKWGKGNEVNYERKQPIKLDIDENAPSVLENTPTVRTDVIRNSDVIEDVVSTESVVNKASEFLRSANEEKALRREKIVIDRDAGVELESTPAELAPGIVRSGFTDDKPKLDEGHSKNLVQRWADKENECLSPTRSGDILVDGKPRWVVEMESAKDAGVFENEPAPALENVVREDYHDDVQTVVPEKHARQMKQFWFEKGQDKEYAPKTQLIRFTPPRERTPPHLSNQAEHQSFQAFTIGGSQNDTMTNGVEGDNVTSSAVFTLS